MAVYVAKDYEGRSVGIVVAKSEELAYAYWQGQAIYPHSVSSYTSKDLKEHPTGVIPLLKTRKESSISSGKSQIIVRKV